MLLIFFEEYLIHLYLKYSETTLLIFIVILNNFASNRSPRFHCESEVNTSDLQQNTWYIEIVYHKR